MKSHSYLRVFRSCAKITLCPFLGHQISISGRSSIYNNYFKRSSISKSFTSFFFREREENLASIHVFIHKATRQTAGRKYFRQKLNVANLEANKFSFLISSRKEILKPDIIPCLLLILSSAQSLGAQTELEKQFAFKLPKNKEKTTKIGKYI